MNSFYASLASFITITFSLCADSDIEKSITSLVLQSSSTASIKIKKIYESGSNTQSVYCVTLDGKTELICKELKEISADRELLYLNNLIPFVAQYEEEIKALPSQFPSPLPSIAYYIGGSPQHALALFKKASGQSVANMMLEWVEKGFDWRGLASSDTRKKLQGHFQNIGHAIGNFHLNYGTLMDNGCFHSIVHGDLHISNVYYNTISNQTTFIDYETVFYSMREKRNIHTDIERLFRFSKKEILTAVQTPKAHSMINIFFNSIQKGYIKAFQVGGYTLTLDKSGYTIAPIS